MEHWILHLLLNTMAVSSSDRWVLAAAPGIVVRTGKGIVIVDMDGDGLEETGWSLMYLHIATNEKVPVGTVLERGSRIGHPSCEGGSATGTHVHLARKYNGEWINATDLCLLFCRTGQLMKDPKNISAE
jgi:murein DD-endopeptidase MepM/ murein hydrolase activator NlpD